MRKRRSIVLGCAIFVIFGYYLSLPQSIETALRKISPPFAVGALVATQQIDDTTTVVLYTNREKTHELQNVILRKKGSVYRVIEKNGSLAAELPKTLNRGDLRAQMRISWYDRSDKYVVMAVAYDEDVASIFYRGQKLEQVNDRGYSLFYGYGTGKYEEYVLSDKNGNPLTHIKA